MSHVVVFGNQKGGVGKSTLSVLYAHWLADVHRQSVCVIDLDTQANSSKTLRRFDSGVSAVELFGASQPWNSQRVGAGHLRWWQGGKRLADIELARPEAVIPAFRKNVASLAQGFDTVVIDTPPALGTADECGADRGHGGGLPDRTGGVQHRRRDRHAQDDLRGAAALQPQAAAGGHRAQPLQSAFGASEGGDAAVGRPLSRVRDPGADLDAFGHSGGAGQRGSRVGSAQELGARGERRAQGPCSVCFSSAWIRLALAPRRRESRHECARAGPQRSFAVSRLRPAGGCRRSSRSRRAHPDRAGTDRFRPFATSAHLQGRRASRSWACRSARTACWSRCRCARIRSCRGATW